MTDPIQNEKAIFLAALEYAAGQQREDFVRRACGDQADLLNRVQRLMSAHDKPAGPLDSPPLVMGKRGIVGQSMAECVGTQIGPYKLLEVIGEGGMGIVYMADQLEPVRRRVAVKVVRPGMDSQQVIARFEAERQALAVMDHPNIARILDGGVVGELRIGDGGVPLEDTDAGHSTVAVSSHLQPAVRAARSNGRPYFVMELVPGAPITSYCDEYNLPIRERLELFVSVCQAIQHAHNKGIIHRDIKPTNVLVTPQDGHPTVKVIDFGVAKAVGYQLTENSLYTDFAQVIGTPLYMSPEQARLSGADIDTRTDVYSLGVLLYELLTGTTPVDKEHLKQMPFDEIRRIIREDDPPKPSTRISTVPAAPSIAAHRQTEPAKLACLVRGELDWLVMKALEKDRDRRYESANALGQDVKRYLANEPVLACPPSSWYRFRKFAQRNRAALSIVAVSLFFLVLLALGAGWALRDQEARRTKLAGQLEPILAEVEQREAEQKWPDALAAARRAETLLAGAGADEEQQRRVHGLLADLTLIQRLEQIRQGRVGTREGQPGYEWSDHSYAAIFREHGIDFEVLTAEDAARKLCSRGQLVVALTAVLDDWASCRIGRRNAAGAKALRTIAQQIDPDSWRRQVREALMLRDYPALESLVDSPDLLRQPPATLYLLGSELCYLGKVEQGIKVLRKGQWQYPDDFWISMMLGYRVVQLGPDHRGESLGFLRAAAALRPESAMVWQHLGTTFDAEGKPDEAIAYLTKAIELNPNYASAHNVLGYVLSKQKKLDEALVCFTRAAELDPKFVHAHHNRASAFKRQNRVDEAIPAYWQVLELDPNYANAGDLQTLFNLIRAQKDRDKTISFFTSVVQSKPKNALAHWFLGNALWYQGRVAESLGAFQRGSELAPHESRHFFSFANALTALNRLDEAIVAYEKAIELAPKDVHLRYEFGIAWKRKGLFPKALDCWRKTVEMDAKYLRGHTALAWHLATNPDRTLRNPLEAVIHAQAAVDLAPENPNHWSNLGVALWRAGDFKAAIENLEKADQMTNDGDHHHRFFLAMAYWQMGEKDKARQTYDAGVEWMDKNQPDNDELRRFRAEAEDLMTHERTESTKVSETNEK